MRSIEEVETAIKVCDRIIINLLKTEEDEDEEEERKRKDEIRLRFISCRSFLQWVFDEKKDDWI